MPMPDEPGVKLRCSYNELCDLVAQLDLRMAALEQRAQDATEQDLRNELRNIIAQQARCLAALMAVEPNTTEAKRHAALEPAAALANATEQILASHDAWQQSWRMAASAAVAYRDALIDIAQIAESHAQSATAFSLIAEANSRAAAFASIAERARAALQEHPAAASQHGDPCARYDADTDAPATFEDWLIQARAGDGLRPLDAWQAATARAVVIVQGYLDSYPADITLPTPSSQSAQTFYDALAPALRRALTDIIAAIKGA